MGFRIKGFTMDQLMALMMLEQGYNVFLTGGAGTGKTFVINQFIKRHPEKTILITATTGLAAVSIGGTTMHSTFRIPIRPIGPSDIKKIEEEPIGALPTGVQHILETLEKVDTIIIDEISMCRFDAFEYFYAVLDRASHLYSSKQIQVIVVGDFFQLPPVIQENKTRHEKKILQKLWNLDNDFEGFAFETPAWGKLKCHSAILNEVVRQSDRDFINSLNFIRTGQTDYSAKVEGKDSLDNIIEMSSPDEIPSGIYLYSHKKDALIKNEQILGTLPGPDKPFESLLESDKNIPDTEIIPPKQLHLKIGARVMAVLNDPDMPGDARRYFNGLQGTVKAINVDPQDETQTTITVAFDNGNTVDITKHVWDVTRWGIVEKREADITPFEEEKYTWKPSKKPGWKWSLQKQTLAHYRQYPLRLAYAMTIHKAQGQTFSSVNLDLTGVFAPGQVYVGLSRCRHPRELYISPFDKREISKALSPSGNVFHFYFGFGNLFTLHDAPTVTDRNIALQAARDSQEFGPIIAQHEAEERKKKEEAEAQAKAKQDALEKAKQARKDAEEKQKAEAKAAREAIRQKRVALAKQVKAHTKSLQGKHVLHPEWGEGTVFFVFPLTNKFRVRFPSAGIHEFDFSEIGTHLTLLDH